MWWNDSRCCGSCGWYGRWDGFWRCLNEESGAYALRMPCEEYCEKWEKWQDAIKNKRHGAALAMSQERKAPR